MAQASKALVIIDVQNEFLSPEGNFPCPEESTRPLIDNLIQLIPRFRASGGQIIWVQALYEDLAEEPESMKAFEKGTDGWLTNATHVYHVSCCKAGTFGSEIHPDLWACVDADNDKVVNKANYSAFKDNTQLLDVLREKGVTDAHFCGIASGTCVLATVLDAVNISGLRNHVVVDCLGYRRLNNHEEALERLKQIPGLVLENSEDVE